MPGPSSETATSMAPSDRCAVRTVIVPFSCAYLSALSTRFPIACASSRGSPAMHELFCLIAHTIDRLRKQVEFISRILHRQAARQISLDDGRGCLADAVYLGKKHASNLPSAQDADQQDDPRGACQPVPEEG